MYELFAHSKSSDFSSSAQRSSKHISSKHAVRLNDELSRRSLPIKGSEKVEVRTALGGESKSTAFLTEFDCETDSYAYENDTFEKTDDQQQDTTTRPLADDLTKLSVGEVSHSSDAGGGKEQSQENPEAKPADVKPEPEPKRVVPVPVLVPEPEPELEPEPHLEPELKPEPRFEPEPELQDFEPEFKPELKPEPHFEPEPELGPQEKASHNDVVEEPSVIYGEDFESISILDKAALEEDDYDEFST
jgi:hypothetical protein